jgi:DNA-binding CsgD family transcriptional regulator
MMEDILHLRKLQLRSFTSRIAGGDFQGWEDDLTDLAGKMGTENLSLKLGYALHFCSTATCLDHLTREFSKKGEWTQILLALECFVFYNLLLILKEDSRNGLKIPGQRKLDCLTHREKEVVRFVLEGWTSKETAVRMGISVKTVEAHRANIMKKLGINNVAQLARYVYTSTPGQADEKKRV